MPRVSGLLASIHDFAATKARSHQESGLDFGKQVSKGIHFLSNSLSAHNENQRLGVFVP
jgi:hypothetical protein